MPRYYGQADPIEQYQGSGFDPMTGRLQMGQIIQQFLLRKRADEERKKQEGWEVEDRELGKRYKEAQISNLYETTPPKEQKPISNVAPAQVKSLMKRLGYPEEAISEVDTMNDVARKDTWAKLQDHFRQITAGGGKVPTTAATSKGRIQYQRLKAALDTVKSRKTYIGSALTQLLANPDKAMLSPQLVESLRGELDSIESQEGEIASMMNNIDESGELTEQQFTQLNTILKFKRSYIPYKPKPKELTEAEKKLPAGARIIK